MKNTQQQLPFLEPAAETLPVSSPITTNDPELERLRTENTDLQNSLRMRNARDELTRSLTDAGARSPQLLFAAAKDGLQFSGDGMLQNTAAIVAHLKSEFPDQFGIQKPSASIDAGTGTLSSAQMLTAESLTKMTPAQIQKLNWDDVRQVIGNP